MVIHIVDNDPQMRAATSFALARQGYKTQIYTSIEELLGLQRLGDGCILLAVGAFEGELREVIIALEERGTFAPVILIGEDSSAAEVIHALRQGASDFVQRPHDESDLIAAIERAMDRSREVSFNRHRKTSATSRLAKLSPRKRQVLQGLLAGMSNKVIAQQLALSPRTVELHRATLMEELGVLNLAEALRMAIDAELTPLDDTVFEGSAPQTTGQTPTPAPTDDPAESRGRAVPPLPPVRDALEGTTDCVFLVDRNWRFTFLNRNAREVLSGDRDLVGRCLWDEYPLAGATRAWDELHRAANDRQASRFEFYEPDLHSWLDVSVRPFAGGLQVSFRNINEARCAGAQLQLSEETLLQALEAAGDGAWDWNVQTGEIAMSANFLRKLGYGNRPFPETFESFIHLVHPEDLPTVKRCLQEHLEGSSNSFRCEYRLRRHDGEWLWNLDRGRVVARDPITALPLRLVGTASDITHIKEAQQKAEEAFERLALAQANAGVGTWELALDTGELRFCKQSRAMHGLAEDPYVPLNEEDWSRCVHPDDRGPAVEKLRAYVACGQTYRMRYRVLHADGSTRWILGMGKAVTGVNGQRDRFVGLNIDITGLVLLTTDNSTAELAKA